LTALTCVELCDIIPKSIQFCFIAMTNPDDKLPYHCKSIGDSEVIRKPMTVHDWWPDTLNLSHYHAPFPHSTSLLLRFDGHGGGNSGNICLLPLNSWPDNGFHDKACMYILWPIKQKYGQSISNLTWLV
ncbi:hypothetical protein ACHAXA_004164, partial [Cyclostephanos tholiformis]